MNQNEIRQRLVHCLITYRQNNFHSQKLMARLLYNNANDFEHISRYSPYRTIINTYSNTRYFESVNRNTYTSDIDTIYHIVEPNQEGRLDIISNIYYGTPAYFWAIADANNIIDPMVIVDGTVLLIPSINSLYMRGGPLERM